MHHEWERRKVGGEMRQGRIEQEGRGFCPGADRMGVNAGHYREFHATAAKSRAAEGGSAIASGRNGMVVTLPSSATVSPHCSKYVQGGMRPKAAMRVQNQRAAAASPVTGLSDSERAELQRLKEIAVEYSKVREENEQLQADLDKSKKLNKNLRKENRRLFRRQNSKAGQEAQVEDKKEPRDPLEQHVAQQLQQLLAEKAQLVRENCQLTRDNQSLQELLRYAVGERDESCGSEACKSELETRRELGSDLTSISGCENEGHRFRLSDIINRSYIIEDTEEYKEVESSPTIGQDSTSEFDHMAISNDHLVPGVSLLPFNSSK